MVWLVPLSAQGEVFYLFMYQRKHIGELIKYLLERKNITRKEFIIDSGIDKSALSRVLLGHYSLTPTVAIRISEGLQCYGYTITPLQLLNHQNKYLLIYAQHLLDNGL